MSKKSLNQMSTDQSEKLINVVTELSDKDLEKFVGGTSISYGSLGADGANKPSGSGSGTYHRGCTQQTRCARG